MKANSNKWCTESELKKLGFNQDLKRKLLPEPIVRSNFRYRGALPTKLWKKEDVETAMESLPFLLYKALKQINVDRLPLEEMQELYAALVKRDYNPDFFEHWCVNHIRHAETDYDRVLSDLLSNGINKDEAHALFKAKVLLKIIEIYPEFADNAEEQIRATFAKLPPDLRYIYQRVRIRGRAL